LNKTLLVSIFSLVVVSSGSSVFAQNVELDVNIINIMDPVVILETNLGEIVIEFFPNDAPKHVENFIKLSQSGFYDGVLFHRIIPGFMIQGGDPNTIDGDPNSWGTGGPSTSVDAEFNTIKHNRGIVSMARSADPNSGGSQFFIIHQDSNFLDGQYTVFGRIITEESFETLDKITAVETGTNDRPIEPDQVRIIKTKVVSISDISNHLDLKDPERTQSPVTPSTGNQQYQSTEHEIKLSVPEGWLLQEQDKTQPDSPDVVAVGPKTGVINPVISLTIQESNQRTFDELISEKLESIKSVIETGELKINSHKKMTINEYDAYVTEAEGLFLSNGEKYNVQFKEIIFYDNKKFYTLAYSNGADDFDSQLPKFNETIESFIIISPESSSEEISIKENGGCLIATATFGSELAPQVQQLRELRDNTILSTKSGTVFMSGFNQFYYSFSPVIADMERENPLFKEFVKLSITPMLSTLSILNYAEIDSEEEMLSYGIGIILMNIGMYFAAPALIIYKIRK